MFDQLEIIQRARQRNYPANWQVYRGRGNNGCAITLGIVIVCGIPTVLSTQTVAFREILLTIVLVVLILPLIGTLNAIYRKRSLLVILPEGVVRCYGGNLKKLSWLYFPRIERLELAERTEIRFSQYEESSYQENRSKTYYWLDIYNYDGTYYKWTIEDFLGDTAILCKTIIAAHTHYQRYNQS